MERLTLNQEMVERLRAECEANYPTKSTPLPGSYLKVDDDIWWLDMVGARVLWGYDTADYIMAYCPDWFGDSAVMLDALYIADRAPADSQETPMPIWPTPQGQQQQQRQPGPRKDGRSREERLRDLIKLQPDKEVAKKMREIFHQRGLLGGDGKNH